MIPFSLYSVPKSICEYDFQVQQAKYKDFYEVFDREPASLCQRSYNKINLDRDTALVKTKVGKRKQLSLNLTSLKTTQQKLEEERETCRNLNGIKQPSHTKTSSYDISVQGHAKNFSIIP